MESQPAGKNKIKVKRKVTAGDQSKVAAVPEAKVKLAHAEGEAGNHQASGHQRNLERQPGNTNDRSRRDKSWKQGNTGNQSSQRHMHSQRRPLSELLEYLKACTRTMGEGLASKEDEALLATRAIEEIGDRVLICAADQRGSRPLERLLRKAGGEAFSGMFKTLMEAVPELGPNQYASHVLQTALASWADRLDDADSPSKTDAIVALCTSLVDGGLAYLATNSCGSHVVRALILSLGGYAPGQENRDRLAAKAGLLPEKRTEVSAEVANCRRSIAVAFLKLVREDEELCLNPHASPVIILLLRVLRDRSDRSLVADLASAIVGASSPSGAPSNDKCESLVHSAPGSRTLEAVLETSTAEGFASLFSKFFRPRLGALIKGEAGDFGAFLAQRVADGLRDEPQLVSAIAEVDFASCLNPAASAAQQAVAVKFAEACLRLRAGLKPCAAAIFKALELNASTQYPRVWPTLLALEHTDSASSLLKPVGKTKDNTAGDDPQGYSGSELKNLRAAGPHLLGALLRFPADAVQPLNSGLPKLLEHPEVLVALAREKKTAQMLERALAPGSALLPKLRGRLARSFKGTLGQLGPHHIGGWVCAALWRASLSEPALREAFSQELIAVEDALRQHNFAVWKVCGLHQAKVRKEEWKEQQQKGSKASRLFDSILEDGDPEAAKAAKLARERAAEDAADREALAKDPMLASLMAPEVTSTKGDKAKADKEDSELDVAEDDLGADAELDSLFSRKEKPWQKRAKKRKVDDNDATKSLQPASAAAGSTPKPQVGDALLLEALNLISGKGPAKASKSMRKKMKRAAAASESEDDAEAAPQEATQSRDDDDDVKPKKKKRKKIATT